ncbi:hypothetical protein [Acinetobacter baumannii]|uniref:hypothetical protein n=1 Tax=Acinetobacter baumannii TaxID=470 RepID=UPI0024160702|nr:hypothetical protein [Acinetobacter baumannii]WFQ22511.1 hypothetical protein P9J63_05900 [Acinetobacter baumannii]WFQ26128.1 hypothetical protein P9J61_05885 [Acinetobacter baumannii]WFQ29779.1 hypothetical protein P9J59_05890 [Acinetobacter baumannii]
MTNLKNELVKSQVESVEGEYLNAREYACLRMEQMREEIDAMHRQSEERVIRNKQAERQAQISALRTIFTKMV